MSGRRAVVPGAAACALALALGGCGPVEDEADRQRERIEREVERQGDRVRTQLDRLSVPTVPDITVPDVTVPDVTIP